MLGAGIWHWSFIAGAVAGALLVAVGWRGRRIDGHLVCRRCGYDLFGIPDGIRCSECGSDLRQRRATHFSHRRRRHWAVWAGLSLMLPSTAGLGGLTYAQAHQLDAQAFKPAWLLTWELDSSNAVVRDAAIAELERRLSVRMLSAEATSDVVDWVLDRQACEAGPWDRRWGALVERAHANRDVSAEQWRRFSLQALGLYLELGPPVRRGESLEVTIGSRPRMGNSLKFEADVEWKSVRLGRWKMETPPEIVRFRAGHYVLDLVPTDQVPTGEVDVEVQVSVRVGENLGYWLPHRPRAAPPQLVTFCERAQVLVPVTDTRHIDVE